MKMMIGYTKWELYNLFDKYRCEMAKYEEDTPEYKELQGKVNRILMLDGAFSDWGKALRGCWYCWDDMVVVEEDRENMKNIPGYDEDEIANDLDLDNTYSGIPAIMCQPVKIRKTIIPVCKEDYDPDMPVWYNNSVRHDLVSSENEEVLLANISHCPYCARDLDETWGKKYRNNDKFGGIDDESWDYYYDNIDDEPWDE